MEIRNKQNVVIDEVTHDARARNRRTACGIRFTMWIEYPGVVMARETSAAFDCMACLARPYPEEES